MVILYGSIALETRSGNPIPNSQRHEQNPVRLEAAAAMFESNHATVKSRSCTGVYNCFGMVFANRRTVVDNDQGGVVEMILSDDDYFKIRRNQCVNGDVVVYRDPDDEIAHVGMVIEFRELDDEIYVLSQWGADGEFFHREDDVHATLGKPTDYWTERKQCQ